MVKAKGAKLDFSSRDDSGDPDDINLKDGFIDKISIRATFPRKRGVVRKARDSAVKMNSELLVSVEEFINLDENKFRYVNRKQFIDIAVSDFLRREKRKVKK